MPRSPAGCTRPGTRPDRAHAPRALAPPAVPAPRPPAAREAAGRARRVSRLRQRGVEQVPAGLRSRALRQVLVVLAEAVEVVLLELLQVEQRVARLAARADQLVEL